MIRNTLDDFKWQLDVNSYELDQKVVDLLFAADMLQEYKMSIRGVANECMISKSKLHEFLSNGELRSISYELYQLCRKQLVWNKMHPSYFIKRRR